MERMDTDVFIEVHLADPQSSTYQRIDIVLINETENCLTFIFDGHSFHIHNGGIIFAMGK